MPTDLHSITQATLKTSPAWAQAFRDYASSQRSMGNLDLLISGEKLIRATVWADFMDSKPAQVLLENPPAPGTPWDEPEHAPIPQSVPVPVPAPQTIPETSKVITPEPAMIHTPEKVQVVSSNPIVDAIMTELQRSNFIANQALTAQEVQTIAASTTHSIVNTVLERLEREGKLNGKKTIQYQIQDKPIKELQGKVPSFFDDLLKLVLCGIPSFLVGPAGSGKTTAVEMLAEQLSLPFVRVSLSAGVDEGNMTGWLLPMELGGRFIYVPAPMVKAYEGGGVVLLDEIDAADANMLIIMSAVLDDSAWHIAQRADKPALVKSDQVYFVAAANTWGHGADHKFVGANQLDERTLSRFRQGQIACDYDSELEAEIFDENIVEFGHILRRRCRDISEFPRDVSTRDIALNTRKVRKIHQATGKPVFTPAQAWYHHFSDWKAQELSAVHVRKNDTLKTVSLD